MRRQGFTFIEILVSVTIVAVLLAIGVASYASVNRRARDAKRKSDLEQVRSALEQYRADNGSYPIAASWSLSYSTTTCPDWIDELTPAYMDSLPCDPKNNINASPGTTPAATYAYRSSTDCGVTAGSEYMLGTVLESGETAATTYGTCGSYAGWYMLGEK